MSFTVAQSTAEIGLRIALGATASDIVLRVLKHGLGIAAAGLGLGLVGAYIAGRAMQSSLYGTGAIDWTALSTVAAILLFAAFFACYVPARRASSMDPISALRRD
jgi:putative ABC transport system permease protein